MSKIGSLILTGWFVLALSVSVRSASALAAATMDAHLLALYGPGDQRHEPSEIKDPGMKLATRSVAAVISQRMLDTEPYGARLSDYGDLKSQIGLCEDEKFGRQPVVAGCTAFLVRPDVVATAGHCIAVEDCADRLFVFGYELAASGAIPEHFSEGETYRCQKVLAFERDQQGADYALVKLDRPVIGHPVARLAAEGVTLTDPLYSVGFPASLPLKITTGGSVRRIGPQFFVTQIDNFGGNSGAPLFRFGTNEVVGLLSRGERDFAFDAKSGCVRSFRSEAGGGRGEDATQISAVREALNRIPLD